MKAPDLPRVAGALALVEKDLDLIEGLIEHYLQLVCTRISVDRADKEWYRIAGESRPKPATSVTRALTEMDTDIDNIWEIDDMVGGRVVVVTLSDANELAHFIMDDDQCDLEKLVRHDDPDREGGYRAIHLKGWLQANVEGTSTQVGCEIQIRTELQDAWAVVSRAAIYKQRDLPEDITQQAKKISNRLYSVDLALDRLKRRAEEHRDKSRDRRAKRD